MFVTLGSTSSSVTSISNSKASGTWDVAALATVNGTGIRMELWHLHTTGTQTSNVITVNISPSTTIALAAEEYSGVNSTGLTVTDNNTGQEAAIRNTMTQAGSYIAGGLGFATASATTATVQTGSTSRQSSIGVSALGEVLYDSTATAIVSLLLMTLLNASQNWVSIGVELKSGGTATALTDFAAVTGPALTKGIGVNGQTSQMTFANPTVIGNYGFVS